MIRRVTPNTETSLPMDRPLDEMASTTMALRVDADANGNSVWLLCRAAKYLCVIPLAHVIETMRVLPIEPVPGAPRFVRGLSVIRGAAVPVVDMGLMLSGDDTVAGRFVTIRVEQRTIALLVTAVIGTHALNAAERAELPPLMRHAAGDAVSAISAVDSELLFVLDSARVVPAELLRQLESGVVVA